MGSKLASYELFLLLTGVSEQRALVNHLAKLWRLFGNGSLAAGLWRALLNKSAEARDSRA